MIYLRVLIIAMFALALSFGSSLELAAKNTKKAKQAAIQEADRLTPAIDEMAETLWDYSETALKETKSAKYLAGKLRAAGFSLEEGVAEMPTAFVATYGSGSPVIGILAEFDAFLVFLAA